METAAGMSGYNEMLLKQEEGMVAASGLAAMGCYTLIDLFFWDFVYIVDTFKETVLDFDIFYYLVL